MSLNIKGFKHSNSNILNWSCFYKIILLKYWKNNEIEIYALELDRINMYCISQILRYWLIIKNFFSFNIKFNAFN